jgi:chorismate mutase
MKSGKTGFGSGGTASFDRELRTARMRIDRIDGRMIGLLARRRAAVAEVGRVKRLRGLPVEDAAREAEILGRIRDRHLSEGVKGYVEAVYRAIFRISREVERED